MSKEHGAFLSDGQQVITTLQCPHCGNHFDSWPGSGKRRAFCRRCMEVTCGNPQCDACVPFDVRLDNYEGAKIPDSYKKLIIENGIIL